MSINSDQIRSVLSQFINDPDQYEKAVHALRGLICTNQISGSDTAAIDGANIDLGRLARCGFPEVVFAEGKSVELIAQILKTQHAAGQRAFATRVSDEQAAAVHAVLPVAHHNELARTIMVPAGNDETDDDAKTAVQVAVISAGSCDAPVAQEALETLRWMQISAELIEDVGVAGPQRLQKNVARLQTMDAIVCVAGMEAALPSVVGGYVSCPVIGVPTSVGYGASFSGITALLSMLTCCASNVVTVNIDAGFRGGYVAGMIARRSVKQR